MASTSKQLSITIEEELYKEIKKLIKITGDLNVSKVINLAVKDFFKGDSEYSRIMSEIDDNILIPIKQYISIFGLTEKTVKSQISKGTLKTINIGGKRYIKLDPDDKKNIFYEIEKLKKRIDAIEKKLD